MIRVQENTIVEVGKIYLVQHAVVRSHYTDRVLRYTPMIGVIHKDPQFSVNYTHAHIDGRFAKFNQGLSLDAQGKTNAIIRYGKSENHYAFEYFTNTVWLKRKCLRTTTGINPPPGANKYNDWSESMIGKSCAGKRCPHLGTAMNECNGVLICPLHDLHGDRFTEKIISRFQK